MQTQKDHVDAYAFHVARMSSALVLGNPGPAETPTRRAWTGFVVGIVVALLIAAGFFLYGLIAHQQARAAQPQRAALSTSYDGGPGPAPRVDRKPTSGDPQQERKSVTL